MSEDKKLDLLMDLAKLLKKYGPEPFENLSESISSLEITERLKKLLEGPVSISRSVSTPLDSGADRVPRTVREKLEALKNSEPQKYELLASFHASLFTKVFLPTLRDIRNFARDHGLHEITSKGRSDAIAQLIKQLIPLSYEDLREKLTSSRLHRDGDRSLEAWSDLILGKSKNG